MSPERLLNMVVHCRALELVRMPGLGDRAMAYLGQHLPPGVTLLSLAGPPPPQLQPGVRLGRSAALLKFRFQARAHAELLKVQVSVHMPMQGCSQSPKGVRRFLVRLSSQLYCLPGPLLSCNVSSPNSATCHRRWNSARRRSRWSPTLACAPLRAECEAPSRLRRLLLPAWPGVGDASLKAIARGGRFPELLVSAGCFHLD